MKFAVGDVHILRSRKGGGEMRQILSTHYGGRESRGLIGEGGVSRDGNNFFNIPVTFEDRI